MAKSNLIKDLANRTISLEVALRKSLVLASDLNNDAMKTWVQQELTGYPQNDKLPAYRRLKGVIKATYTYFGRQRRDEPTDISYVFGSCAKDQDVYLCYDGISFIERACNDAKLRKIENSILTKQCRSHIDYVYLEIPVSEFLNAVAFVTNKLMNILIQIDNEVGNIDNLDIVTKNDEQKIQINQYITNYIGGIIDVGNNNNNIVKSSLIGGQNDE